MGICGSRSTSARSTVGSERSEKCRWDKHGNVFFPVKRQAQQQQQQRTTAEERKETDKSFLTTTNPVYDFESPSQLKNPHFSSFTKFLKGSQSSSSSSKTKQHPHEAQSSLPGTRSRRAAYKDIFVAARVLRGGSRSEVNGTTAGCSDLRSKSVKQPASLSRSSSTKEGSLTRSSSVKEAALSRCSSEKEGKMAAVVTAATTAELLACVSGLKLHVHKAAEEPTLSKESPTTSDRGTAEKALDPNSLETSSCSHLEKLESSSGDVMPGTSSFVSNGVGVPSYQPLVFSAGSSPEKCRGRPHSLEDQINNARPRRRRSPSRISPSRRSPGKRSPTSKKAGGNGLSLNSSAARFQRSLPNRRPENVCPREVSARSQIPKISSAKVMSSQDRPALRELPKNSLKSDDKVPARSLPPKPSTQSKDSGPASGASVLNGDARTGSKRLRSPKKPVAVDERVTKEYVNLNVSVPPAGRSMSGRYTNVSLEVPIEDKHESISDKNVGHRGLDTLQERELLELLERTPKKLKKMALKLALMIELEHCRDAEETEEGTLSGEQAQTRAYVMSNSGQRNDNDSLDLELKLGMSNEKSRRTRDGLRLGVSVGVDSPTRAGSVSLPITPRQSVTSICKGLSVEARIGSSRGDISCSDISVHILKNPEKLFGGPSKQKSAEAQDPGPESCGNVKDAGPGSDEPIDRCPSFGFERDRCVDGSTAATIAPADELDAEQLDTESKQLDLNKDSEASPAFEFKLKPSMKSSPATPMMPSVVEKDALSLSADEIAEIWGAFEAGQGTPGKVKVSS